MILTLVQNIHVHTCIVLSKLNRAHIINIFIYLVRGGESLIEQVIRFPQNNSKIRMQSILITRSMI